MTQTVYTNYWVNQRIDQRKEHGTYASEDEALEGIKAWWEIHDENYEIEVIRTNTGALEVLYGDPNYFYRIESRESAEALPSRSYRVKGKGETDALRNRYQLDDHNFVFDELAEPYRDRITVAMNSIEKARAYSYTEKGRPIVKLTEL